MLHVCKGLVLRTTLYGESDKIVHLLTDKYGRISLLVPRARRLKSRMLAVTEPLAEAIWHYRVFNRETQLPRLYDVETLYIHHHLRNDLLLCTYTAYWFEILIISFAEREYIPHLYDFMQTALHKLSTGAHSDFLTRIVELRLMMFAGWLPTLERCIICGFLNKPFCFMPEQGGRVCISCHETKHIQGHVIYLSKAVQHLLPSMTNLVLKHLGKVSLQKSTHRQLARVCAAWLAAHLPCALRTQSLLSALRTTWCLEGEEKK